MESKKIISNNTSYRNFPMVPRVVFGKGSFSQLGEILLPQRRNSDAPFIFLLDDFFENRSLANEIPLMFNDELIFISADEEPKTAQVDALVARIRENFDELPSGIVGIGGGTLLDLAKAVSILLNNDGLAQDYQGWDLVERPAIYHVGVPTISGTGAEVSRTTVLLGPEKKLGINSDHTTFDQVILDPDLTQTVPKEQWFYTGMDCFIHCIESLEGTYLNAFSQSYGEKALDLCNEFLKLDDGEFAEIHIIRGFANASLEKHKEAIKDFKIALKDTDQENAIKANLAYSYLRNKNHLKALLLYRKISKVYPDQWKVQYNTGLSYFKFAQFRKAMPFLNKTEKLKPDFAGTYLTRGFIYLKKGRKELAHNDFLKAKELGAERNYEIIMRKYYHKY